MWITVKKMKNVDKVEKLCTDILGENEEKMNVDNQILWFGEKIIHRLSTKCGQLKTCV